MNRRELCKATAEAIDMTPAQVEAVLAGLQEQITASLVAGDPITLSGFAKFAKVSRAERQGRNPQTGEAITIKASMKVRITPLKGLKDAVL